MKIEDIKHGNRCHHYKDSTKEYEIIGIGRNTENKEELVIYKALYHSDDFGSDAIWARPLSMFIEKVTVDGQEKDRFELIN